MTLAQPLLDRIAVELGTSPEAARQRVSTAVRTLREMVAS